MKNETPETTENLQSSIQTPLKNSPIGIVEYNFRQPDWLDSDDIETLLGLIPGQLQNSRRLVRSFIHPDDVETNKFARQQEARGIDTQIEIRFKAGDGKYRWVSMASRVIRDASGNPLKVVATMLDIDDLKQAQQKIANSNKARDNFVSLLSHELRNPLAAVSFSLDFLRETESLTENGTQLLENTIRQTEQISNLLKSLLDISNLNQNRISLNRKRYDLNQTVGEVVHAIQPLIAKKQQTLHRTLSDQPLHVLGDSVRLNQAMMNLLENASKYTPDGGEIWLETEPQDGQVRFTVRDSGSGIEESVFEKIFDLFFQASDQKRPDVGGIGIGLYLVDQIVRAHGGSVSVTSGGLGQGSQFTISIPSVSDSPNIH